MLLTTICQISRALAIVIKTKSCQIFNSHSKDWVSEWLTSGPAKPVPSGARVRISSQSFFSMFLFLHRTRNANVQSPL